MTPAVNTPKLPVGAPVTDDLRSASPWSLGGQHKGVRSYIYLNFCQCPTMEIEFTVFQLEGHLC